MTGARGWRSDHDHASQHLLSVFCGCGLKPAGILLHPGELVSDGLDGSRLLVGCLYYDRGLQTWGPGHRLVRDLCLVRLVVGCVWRGGDLVVLVGCLAALAPASAAASAPLGRWWWRQRGGPSGLTSAPPGGPLGGKGKLSSSGGGWVPSQLLQWSSSILMIATGV